MTQLSHYLRFQLPRRWQVLLIGLSALLLLAFYAATDPARVPHNHLLQGADWLGAGICHRITSRSFTVFGRSLPLCARCTGIYLGVTAAFVTLGLAGRWRRVHLPRLSILLLFIGLIGVMGIDGVNSYTHFFPNFPHVYEPRNWLRLVTGMGAGLAMGVILFPALAQTLWRQQEFTPIVTSWNEALGLLLVAAVLVLLVLSNQPLLLYVLALVSVLGILMIVTAINVVLLLTFLRRDGQALRWRDTAVPLLIGLSLAILELTAVAWLRLALTGTISGLPGLA